ncbi:hypothetical protein RirG_220060 [Rhizophagus irregularis DAOM 197198w]|uniref:Uncharacterized protein n=1 Tax=Rhizophagus irregularis (strain DAOM 197198w) TaxID=1432141 RepID=A0A015LMJ7_RHIIW|nr:hypothetical protein RirG_220060 [Rhizophagus irregularis DAOM 197198w]
MDVNTETQVNQSEEVDIDDELIVQEVVGAVSKGGYRNPIIHLWIFEDGRNVRKKVKHVMITIAILDDKHTLNQPNYHYTTVLYPGCEDYESLLNITAPLYRDLKNLKDQGLLINNIKWNFQLYFSFNWKFLAICLGFNGVHSKNFCPWCTISKSQQGDLFKKWNINKEMGKLVEKSNYYKGHSRKPLFDMIPLDH